MKVLRDPLGQDEPPCGSVLSIGNFDGIHLGHQAVLRLVVDRAISLESTAAVMTFDPHPVQLLRPHEAPNLLTTLDQRLELIRQTGIEVAMVVPFTHRLSRMEAADFVRDVLHERLAIREAYIGKNFRFGADRGGDVGLLERLGRDLGFVAAASPIIEQEGIVVSSTRVRRDVHDGRVASAGRLLGRAVHVDGTVMQGKRLGRKLGFPTLNIASENDLLPSKGVYICAVFIPSFDRVFPAVTNIGVRPTVYENSGVTVESHLLDFTADVYDEEVRLFFLDRLRDEQTFISTVQLMAQIRRDVEATRSWFLKTPLATINLIHS